MQILEATELGGVRSAIWLFRHPETPLDIDPAAMGIPTINPDLSRAEFDERWREVPWRQRAVFGIDD